MAEINPTKSTSQRGGSKGKTPKRRATVIAGSIAGVVVIVIAAIILILVRTAGRDRVTFDYANLPRLGSADAPVKVVEFGDFKCPACKFFHDTVFPQLQRTYVDPGVVRFYFMNYPIIGPDSTTAAIAGMAIYHQNSSAFWNYYNAMYANQGDEQTLWATPNFILRLTTRYVPNINYTLLSEDLTQGKYKQEVQAQYSRGEQLGVNSTPTLFVNGHKFLDFSSWPALKAMVEKYK